MKSRRSHRLPFKGYIQRVIRKHRFLVIITLIQAYTPPVSKVYCRYYLYFLPLLITYYEGIIALNSELEQFYLLAKQSIIANCDIIVPLSIR
ncbi:hypothetical protein ACFLV0_07055, partial [Chloroflexota bacterium]